MSEIFVSYAQEDRAHAELLAEKLTEEGLSVGWDRRIPPGFTYDEIVGKALNEARCVIVLWSATSLDSSQVKEEASHGLSSSRLIPVMVENVSPPPGFGHIESAYLDAWNGSPDSVEFRALVDSLKLVLEMDDGMLDLDLVPLAPAPEAKSEPAVEAISETEPEPEPETTVEAVPEPTVEAFPEVIPESVPEPEPVLEPFPEREPEPVPEPAANAGAEPAAEADPAPTVRPRSSLPPRPVYGRKPRPAPPWRMWVGGAVVVAVVGGGWMVLRGSRTSTGGAPDPAADTISPVELPPPEAIVDPEAIAAEALSQWTVIRGLRGVVPVPQELDSIQALRGRFRDATRRWCMALN